MNERILGWVQGLFLLIFAITAVAAVVAVRTINQAGDASDWVNRTHSLIYELDGMRSSLEAGEGRMRAYVLSQDARDLAEARAEFAAVGEHADLAGALLAGEPTSPEILARLKAIAAERVALASALGAARQRGNEAGLQTLLHADAGSPRLAEFRRELERLRNRQFELLSERDRESYRRAHATRWIVGLGVSLNLVLLLGVAWLLREDIGHRRRAATALKEANELLEIRVQQRTAELVAANRQLVAENRERRWANTSQQHQLRYNQVIINSVSDLVFVLTKALNVTRVNPAALRQTGLAEDRLLGSPLSTMLVLADGASFDDITREMKSGRETSHPVAMTDNRGRTRPGTLTIVPLRDRDTVVGAVAVVRLPPD